MIAPRDNAMMTSDVWPQMKSCIAYCQLPGIQLATVYNLEFDLVANASELFALRLPTSCASHSRLITDSGSDVAK